MNVLTPSGYVNIEDLNIGDQVIAYDINDGHIIYNTLEGKELWTLDRYQDEYGPDTQIYRESGSIVYNESGSIQYDCLGNILYDEEGNILYYESSSVKLDCDGNPVYDRIPYWETVPGPLIRTKEEIYSASVEDRRFYKINDAWDLYKYQSIWANMNVIHAKDLQVGDIIYNGLDEDVLINTIVETTGSDWWRLVISGDHSYIADNLTLHNASRYWVGGGASTNWNASPTNWSSTSGGSSGSSAPTASDDVFFDAAGLNSNTDSNINTAFTINSLTVSSSYTAAMSHSAQLSVSGNILLTPNYKISASSTTNLQNQATATINMGGQIWPGTFTFVGSGITKTISGSNLVVSGGATDIGNNMTINRASNEEMLLSGFSYTLSVVPTVNVPIRITTGSISITSNSPTFNGGMYISGNVSIGTVHFTGLLVYQTGSVITAGSALNLRLNSTLDVGPITWNNVTFTSTGTTILSSSLDVGGSTTVSAATTLNTASLATTASLNVRGGITVNANLSGNAKVVLIGGSWTGNAAGNAISNNTDISGSITLNGANVRYGGTATNVLRWVSGSVAVAGSTFNTGGSCTLDVERITFNAAVIDIALSTITLSSSVYVSQSTDFSFAAVNSIFNKASSNPTASWYTRGMALFQVNASGGPSGNGNAKFVLTGGNFGQVGRTLTVSHDIDISGSITVTGSITLGSQRVITVTWISGSVTAANSSVSVGNTSINFNTPGVTWGNLSITAATLNSVSPVIVGGTLSLGNTPTFTGLGGWTANSVSYGTAAALTCSLQPAVEYTILNSFTSNAGRTGTLVTYASSDAVTRSILTLQQGATCNLNANFLRIDASRGRSINTWNGLVSNCVNVNSFYDKKIVAGSL